MTYNRVILAGNVGRHIRRHGDNGQVLRFTLATERWERGDQEGDRREVVEWHDVVYFNGGPLADMVIPGAYVMLEGRLVPRTFESDNGRRRVVEIHAQRIIVLRRPEGESGSAGAAAEPEDTPF